MFICIFYLKRHPKFSRTKIQGYYDCTMPFPLSTRDTLILHITFTQWPWGFTALLYWCPRSYRFYRIICYLYYPCSCTDKFYLGLVFKVALKVPVVIHLEGTNVGEGKRILKVRLNKVSIQILRTKTSMCWIVIKKEWTDEHWFCTMNVCWRAAWH